MPSIMAMELQFDSIIIIPTAMLTIIILSLIFTNKSSKKIPPGPWKLPIIGNLHNLMTSPLPHHTLRELSQKYGPIMHLQMGQVSAVVVSSPSIAREVLKIHDLCFAQRPQLLAGKYAAYDDLSIAFAPYGEYWKQMKKVCVLELLSPARVSSFAHIREEEVSNFVESIRSSKYLVNLTELLLTLMSVMTSRAAFGEKIKFGDGFDLITGVEEGSEMATGFNLADLFPSFKFLESVGNMRAKLEKIHVKVDKILQALVDSRIEELRKEDNDKIEKEDLIHILLKIKQSDSLKVPITHEHIKAVIFDMFIAGTDTSAKTAEWAMAEMMKHPAAMKKAQEEVRRVSKGKKKLDEHDIPKMTYLKSVLKESLRLHPPAPLMIPRECREACEINGYEIPLKTKIIINAWAIARDPSYWENPESFWPERFLDSPVDYKGSHFEFIPFGAGRRVCPGMLFGMVAAEFVLAQMLYHFDWELPSGMKPDDLDMSEQFGASVGRKINLRLRAIPFKQLNEKL